MSLGADWARALDPSWLLREAGIAPQAWQEKVLTSTSRRLLLRCCRQSGKSTVAACRALHMAAYRPGSLTLLLSPTQAQSAELFKKMTDLYGALSGLPRLKSASALRLGLENDSRVVSLPGSETSVRGYSAPDLVVIDEAAFCTDGFIDAVWPATVSNPRCVVMMLSTPNGRQGFFFKSWEDEGAWEKTSVTWEDVPHIEKAAVEFYRRVRGETAYRTEFLCEFLDAEDINLFPSELVDRAISADCRVIPI